MAKSYKDISKSNHFPTQVTETKARLRKLHTQVIEARESTADRMLEKWIEMGKLYNMLMQNVEAYNTESEDAKKIKLSDEVKELEQYGIKKTMLHRCVNIVSLHEQFPIAAKVFATSADKEKIAKILKASAKDNASDAAKEKARIMEVNLTAMEYWASDHPKDSLPVLNAEGVRNMLTDFTQEKVKVSKDSDEKVIRKDYPEIEKCKSFGFRNIGREMIDSYEAELFPLAEGTERSNVGFLDTKDWKAYVTHSENEHRSEEVNDLMQIIFKMEKLLKNRENYVTRETINEAVAELTGRKKADKLKEATAHTKPIVGRVDAVMNGEDHSNALAA